ncbi:MAG: hypothetical protein ABS976_19320, partial [Rhodococcus sp. (in: high G+C Gram-positive bacteria)]
KRKTSPVAAKKRRASGVEEIEVVDNRLEMTADCHGYRWVGRFDETTEVVEIMRGPMEGRRFPDPTAAANAVTGHISGDTESHDGWSFWTINNTALGAHLKTA